MVIPDNALKKIKQSPTSVVRFPIDELLTRTRGWYPFENEWDALIVLDACRYDLGATGPLREAFGEPESVWSVGANSIKWIERTFGSASNEKLRQTGMITGNPFIDHAPVDSLAYVDDVLEYGFDKDLGTVPPRPITDRAITAIRDDVAERYVIHYMQPHLPSIENESDEDHYISHDGDSGNNPWHSSLAKPHTSVA